MAHPPGRVGGAQAKVKAKGKCAGKSGASTGPGAGVKKHRPPTDHEQAAGIVFKMLRTKESRKSGASIKSLVYRDDILNKKATYALSCETLRNLNTIKEVLEECQFFDKNNCKRREIIYVWVYELLFGMWRRTPKYKRHWSVAKMQEEIKEAFDKIKTRRGESTADASKAKKMQTKREALPRYVRVNTLKISVDSALSQLSVDLGQGIEKHSIFPDVLVLPANLGKKSLSHLHKHKFVVEGQVVLQGLASCMPVNALMDFNTSQPQSQWNAVDACAAPGNKTTQLAARLDGKGHVFAFDSDPKRFDRLGANVKLCGADGIVTPFLRDFLKVDPVNDANFSDVRLVLLDPSCSGSGTGRSRGDDLLDLPVDGDGQHVGGEEHDDAHQSERRRIDTLACFQEKALRHALSFPKAERVVYSTCSVHVRENECVVASVMAFAERLGFQLDHAIPQWTRRGYPTFEGAEKLVRVDPKRDQTDGFFLALFTRAKQ